MTESLFTDGQVGALVTGILGAAAGVGAVIKYGTGRVHDALDRNEKTSVRLIEAFADFRAELRVLAGFAPAPQPEPERRIVERRTPGRGVPAWPRGSTSDPDER